MSKRKIVKGIVTNGCDDKEYKSIYREKTQEARVKKAIDLDKLDTIFYKKLIKTLKGDSRTRGIISFFWVMGLMGGIVNFTAQVAVTSILYHTIL